MGYRSKVIIGVKSGKLSNEFDKILQKHDFNTRDNVVLKKDDLLKIHTEDDGMKFYTFEYIKWYESDDWCREIVDFLESTQEYYNDDEVFCVGLGEDGITHSEIGNCWEYVEQISEINLID
tara:strand:+ start:169 stop:531 length:363 start_codon:yes stop_codon:yes gene_type:complete